MATAGDFAKMVPGFDFLQGLMKNAGAGLPNIGQWIAPTIDPEELEKRIEQLRTVQFWLEQNARMLGATIQALEVQRMTLSTLKTMNLPVQDIRKSFQLPDPPPAAVAPAPEPAPAPAPKPAPRRATPKAKAGGGQPAAGAVDPMQWWGALTKQFTELAAGALKDGAAAVAPAAGTRTTMPAAPEKPAPAKKAARPSARRRQA